MRICSFATGEYYHLYNRGVEKRRIFIDHNDHVRFLRLLFFCNSSKSVNLRKIRKGLTFADCVDKRGEPNHFHILIKEKDDGNVSVFMQKILTAYTMYFNLKYKRKGCLFESSFKSVHADYDQYLKYLFAYVHLNPLKLIEPKWRERGLHKQDSVMRSLEGYGFSSFSDYLGKNRDESHILSKEEFPEYFQTPKDFHSYIRDWIDYPLSLSNKPRKG